MARAHVRPETLEEKVIWWAIVLTYPCWIVGGLYILGSALGWLLATLSLARRLGLVGEHDRYPEKLPLGCRIWIGGMAGMAVALFVGHIELGLAQTVKSFIGWMKGWELIVIYIYVGATMRIRAAVMFRAVNVLALHTLILTPIFVIAGVLHLSRMEFTSPLVILGGSGAEYFTFQLYSIEPETGQARWQFFAPWAPAAAVIANVSMMFAMYDKSRFWKGVGWASSLTICVLSQSRLGLLVAPIVSLGIMGLANLTKPLTAASGSAACVALLPFADIIIQAVDAAMERFKNARASSSRVRSTLQSIALHRWRSEAPIFGHGTVERGPHLVEFMPIGSHHTWNGLLYVKGIVGWLSLAIPMALTFIELIAKAQTDRVSRAALGIMLVLFTYTFAENLESLIYLYWPGMVIVGIAMRRRFVRPFHGFMGA